MTGHWQREVPGEPGYYWTATRNGEMAGVQIVAYDFDDHRKLVYAGMPVGEGKTTGWGGWWWSEPLTEPDPPTEPF